MFCKVEIFCPGIVQDKCGVCRYKTDVCPVCKEGVIAEDNKRTAVVTCMGQTYHQQCYACMVSDIIV